MKMPKQQGETNPQAFEILRICRQGATIFPDTALMRVMQAPSHRAAEARGTLFMLIAPFDQPPPTGLTSDLLERMGQSYFAASGSITRGLRDALLSANARVWEYNQQAGEGTAVTLGVCCAVLRGQDLYIGQMGPAVAIVLHNNAIRHYPSRSVWIATDDPAALQIAREPALGAQRDTEPNLYHTTCTLEDAFVLASARLLRKASTDQIVSALQAPPTDLTSHFTAFASEGILSALVVRPSAMVRPAHTPSPQGVPQTIQPSPEQMPSVVPPKVVTQDLPFTPAEPPTLPSAEASEEEPAEKDLFEEAEPLSPRFPTLELGPVSEKLGRGARRLKRGAEDILLKVLPSEMPEPPTMPEVPASIPMGAKALVIVSLIIPLIMLFSVVMTRIQYDRARASQYSNAVLQAQFLYDQAVRQQDRELERQELYRAMEAIEQGISIAPEDPTLQELKRRTQHRIDQLEGVVPIYSFVRLYYFEDAPVSPLDSSRIVIHEKEIMVLNRGSNRLYRFFLNDVGDALRPIEDNPVLIRKGDVYDGVEVTEMIDVTWIASAGSQALARFAVLDRSGTLLSYDPRRGIRAQPVGNADIWLSPQAIGAYYGNLYVLDPLLGRLLKYLPSNNEYVKPPLDYLDPALGIDLTGAVDMAIDGSLYILYADGTIKKFHNGVPVEFPMRGFYGSMKSPIAIFVSGPQDPDAQGYVYVADAGNRRILQFTKDGVFVRQFRAVEGEPYMDQLRGLYVDEAERRMFLISGQHFVLCTLPPVEQ